MQDGERVLRVVSNFDQRRNLQMRYPDDYIVIEGSALYGFRADRIVDHTLFEILSAARLAKREAWWLHARCRLAPGGVIERAG